MTKDEKGLAVFKGLMLKNGFCVKNFINIPNPPPPPGSYLFHEPNFSFIK